MGREPLFCYRNVRTAKHTYTHVVVVTCGSYCCACSLPPPPPLTCLAAHCCFWWYASPKRGVCTYIALRDDADIVHRRRGRSRSESSRSYNTVARCCARRHVSHPRPRKRTICARRAACNTDPTRTRKLSDLSIYIDRSDHLNRGFFRSAPRDLDHEINGHLIYLSHAYVGYGPAPLYSQRSELSRKSIGSQGKLVGTGIFKSVKGNYSKLTRVRNKRCFGCTGGPWPVVLKSVVARAKKAE